MFERRQTLTHTSSASFQGMPESASSTGTQHKASLRVGLSGWSLRQRKGRVALSSLELGGFARSRDSGLFFSHYGPTQGRLFIYRVVGFDRPVERVESSAAPPRTNCVFVIEGFCNDLFANQFI